MTLAAKRRRAATDLQLRRLLLTSAGQRVRRRANPPAIRWPRGSRMRYRAALIALVRRARAAVLEVAARLLPEIIAEADHERGGARRDASSLELITRLLGDFTAVLGATLREGEAEETAARAAADVNAHNRVEVGRQLSAVLGVDPIQREGFVDPILQQFIAQNVGLVKSIAPDMLPQLEQLIRAGVRSGKRVEELSREISDRFDVAESRADLIARDQVGKLNAELTESRHKALGIDEYTWSTSRDERVRKDHAALEGTTQRYSAPPITDKRTGRRNNPGNDFQCRCNALPVLPDELR